MEKDRRPSQSEMKPNQVRHAENLAIFTGKFKHNFYINGVPQRRIEIPRRNKYGSKLPN